MVRALVPKLLVYTHRWFGIVLGLLFAGWFVSGVVMMYARMPQLAASERMARLPRLDFSAARIAPAAAAANLENQPAALRLTMWEGHPVYRFQVQGRWQSILADSGEWLPAITADHALREARRFFPEHAATVRYDGYLDTPDQWTLEIARQLPMHRIALGDAAGSYAYITESNDDVVLKTTARERMWAYPGAILHWIYLTPFRRHGYYWGQFIIWSSIAGTVMCLTGLVWGVWRFSPARRYRLKRRPSRTPYAGWMMWHHYAGLAAGVVTLTWIFSGLLSMSPWNWHPSSSPTAAQRAAFSHGPLALDAITAQQLGLAAAALGEAREADVVRFRGDMYLAGNARLVTLDAAPAPATLDRGALLASAAAAGGGAAVDDVAWLDRYDAYYYDRQGELPLPMMRVKYHDPQRTWLYVDPRRGTIARKEERLTRLNRWLYHGLHSLDFPFLYYRRPLWDIVVITLSAAGLALTLTTLMPALYRLRRIAGRIRG